MESERGIGATSRESGLSVSALRFYDAAGILEPVRVDARTGYRFYAAEQVAQARAVAALRRAGVPLAGIRAVLAHRHDPVAIDALLAAHVRRLERGLADARRALSSVRPLLVPEEDPVPTTAVLAAPDLLAALRAVRFAVGADPDLPALASVLLDLDPAGTATAVATDRYRLAAAPAPAAVDGPAAAALLPVGLVDDLLAALPAAGAADAVVAVDALAISVAAGDRRVDGELRPDAFPDHRPLLPAPRDAAPLDVAALRTALVAGPVRTVVRDQDAAEREVAALRPAPSGVEVVDAPGEGDVGVDREFLLQALDAGGPGQLQLALDGPLAPLVLRSERSTSLLMPVRL